MSAVAAKQEDITGLKTELDALAPAEGLRLVAERYAGKVVFSSSLGVEDQALTHIIRTENIPIKIFTLDTGRHFDETYYVWNMTNARYGFKIEPYFPDTAAVEALLRDKGPYSFYESVENRKECCRIRKVEPLGRAIKGQAVWVTGIRADQSAGRHEMPRVEWDGDHGVIKYHPLLDWSLEETWQFVKDNNVPYNELHDKSYPSIGCQPCTRAVRPGEDVRAGRWSWENDSGKECGLHVHDEQA